MEIDIIKGSDLKILLKRKGVKINDLSDTFGLSRITVSKYLNDKSTIPASFIIKVIAYAGLKLEDMIAGSIEPHTIDVDYDDVSDNAAESEPLYLPAPVVPELPASPALDITQLLTKLTEISGVVDYLNQKIEALKDELKE